MWPTRRRWRNSSPGHPDVISVNYAGLPSSPWYELGKKLAPKGTGAVLAFELAGGIDAGKAFVNALTLHSHVANIGDVRSLVIHPASTTHSQLVPEEQLATGVTPGPGAAGGRYRGHRRHPRRPRAGFRRGEAVQRAGPPIRRRWRRFEGADVTIFDVPDPRRCPPRAKSASWTSARSTLENGAVIDDVSHRGAAMGRTVAEPRQRGGRAACADRRLPHHRSGRTGPPHAGLVGRRGRSRRADRHRPLVRGRHQRARRLPRLHRAELARTPTESLGAQGFPLITVRDQVEADVAALAAMGITEVAAVVGGSMGGARALEWIVSHPDRVRAGAGARGRRTRHRRPDRHAEHPDRGDQVRPELAGR